MSTYAPRPGIFVGRPPCANCGAGLQLHQLLGQPAATGREIGAAADRGGRELVCPQAWRPGSPEEARRILEDAEQSGDAARIFAARGDVQRLEGRPKVGG